MARATVLPIALFLACTGARVPEVTHQVAPLLIGAAEIAVDPPVISPSWAEMGNPEVASNGTIALVVWTDFSGTQPVLFATRANAEGMPLDPGGIVVAIGRPSDHAVTYDGASFLVVWRPDGATEGSPTAARPLPTRAPTCPILDAGARSGVVPTWVTPPRWSCC